jgi:serine/threonine protein kinase
MSAMDKYEKLAKVGEGAYGKVYMARDKINGQLVAIKDTLIQTPEEGIPYTSLPLNHGFFILLTVFNNW